MFLWEAFFNISISFSSSSFWAALPRAVITLIANTFPDPFCTPRYTAP
jgi:hypothetical protein